MNFLEAFLKAKWAIRRKGKASHTGSNRTGWVDKLYFLSCCHRDCGLLGAPCSKPHLTEKDLKANDWEAQ